MSSIFQSSWNFKAYLEIHKNEDFSKMLRIWWRVGVKTGKTEIQSQGVCGFHIPVLSAGLIAFYFCDMNIIGFQCRLTIYKHTTTCHLSGTVLHAKTQTMLLESYHEPYEKLWSWVFGWVKVISTEATSSMHVWPISWLHRQEKSSYLTSSLFCLPIKLIYTGKSLKTLPCRHIFCLLEDPVWYLKGDILLQTH